MTGPFLTLRSYLDEDFDTLVSWLPDRRSFVLWGGEWFEYPLQREAFNRHHRETDHQGYSCVDAQAKLIGYFELRELLPREGRLFRVIVDPACRSRGIGRKMIAEGLRIGFEELDFEGVGLGVCSENEAAIRCYRAAGFKQIGCKTKRSSLLGEDLDLLDMRMTRAEWEEAVGEE